MGRSVDRHGGDRACVSRAVPFVGAVPDPQTASAQFAKSEERIELGVYRGTYRMVGDKGEDEIVGELDRGSIFANS